ncbi:MAG: urea ABC transporter permease subunit UrtB [Methylicorpusculum sp.]|uniref:urea ABC transporter permease subunit UrtB n=1 Tax=Methylicorpusculum sp. TaxID=2713644 RepID=UPI002718BF7F|nr:urea ABC transporter permease subunit UrtB [Methylicorpusculum sp.]MDO8939144.1 urea ABC transporter permease subunit UrtB [Methylicorpusculum sp.]MDO9239972.1 urea ABC transporter permease subunit UrtB [Methylicorpusculum sp.]MDP2201481.1 urea ABC transporter permease subunit UrtB [Methylicorpusculum sp.]
MKANSLKRFNRCFAVALLVWLWAGQAYSQEMNPQVTLLDSLNRLKQGAMPDREQALEQLGEVNHPRTLTVLQALLNGKLYQVASNEQLVIAAENSEGYQLIDAITGEDLGNKPRSDVNKINLTNTIRVKLRKLIGQLELKSEDATVRLAAVNGLIKATDDNTLALLRQLETTERDEAVLEAMQMIFALNDLKSEDKAIRLTALVTLKDFNNQEVVNRLNVLMEKDSAGQYLETDADVRKQAKLILSEINARIQFYSILETLFFGLSLGAVLVLAAIGLAITFGVMGVINMAHGELMMLGAYTTYVIQQMMPDHLGLSIVMAIPAAFLISGLVGIAIERGIIRFLYGRPLETLLATFGVSLFLQQTVRSIFSPLNRSVTTPEWMSGSLQINDFLSLTWNRFYILVFCLMVFVLLLQILKRTRLGLEVRAVAQNRGMAKVMGIPTDKVDAMTFGLGSGIAGVAGVALSQITNVGPNLGQAYIVDSFMVVVFGGVGNLWGTLVAGFSLGIANKILEPYAGAVLAKILVLVFIILFIQKRPSGLFPQKGRAVEAK